MSKLAKLNKILYAIMCVLLSIALLAFISMCLYTWSRYVTHRYDGKVFYVTDLDIPSIKDTEFVANSDGSYTAKLYGIFPMGRCSLYRVARPKVTIANSGLYIPSTGVGSVKIKEFSYENSPAEKAGLQAGDYIYSCNDFIVSSGDWDLSGAVSYIRPNKMTVIRDGQYLTFYVPTDEKNLMGIHYGPSNAILGTMSFLDDGYFWCIGHDVDADIDNAQGTFASFGIDETGIYPVITSKELDYTIKATTEQGVLCKIDNSYPYLNSREVELGWSWEIDCSKPATVELALTDDYDRDPDEVLDTLDVQKVGVTIEAYTGNLSDTSGKPTVAYSYCIKSDGFNFLKGMSGSPVFQNNRLIGILSAVDVNDSTKAFILSAEDAYAQYLTERNGLDVNNAD